MKCIKTALILILSIAFLACFTGCFSYDNARKTTVEFVEVHEAELLELYAMYEAVELSGSDDYSDIRAFKEVHFDEVPYLDIRYYGIPEKMVIWFDYNRDGRDWGLFYCADPNFDITAQAHTEVYEEIQDGFYTYIYDHGF